MYSKYFSFCPANSLECPLKIGDVREKQIDLPIDLLMGMDPNKTIRPLSLKGNILKRHYQIWGKFVKLWQSFVETGLHKIIGLNG